ncbi:hypothetical protein PCASD_13769 [Puccinia coronata f. sp. avenae]|uniref:Uncharacterized protein n=1 Tax=Puccinia coronata f. sp. avenae TaxID=200324 RepID=A0A2N5ULL7_9BASI|nr:hypothetical protein PCASD_13769 [Puccinia coronata f. sp. avenae]
MASSHSQRARRPGASASHPVWTRPSVIQQLRINQIRRSQNPSSWIAADSLLCASLRGQSNLQIQSQPPQGVGQYSLLHTQASQEAQFRSDPCQSSHSQFLPPSESLQSGLQSAGVSGPPNFTYQALHGYHPQFTQQGGYHPLPSSNNDTHKSNLYSSQYTSSAQPGHTPAMYFPPPQSMVSNTHCSTSQPPPALTPLPNWEQLNANAEAALEREREASKGRGKKTRAQGRGSSSRGRGSRSQGKGAQLAGAMLRLQTTPVPAINSATSRIPANNMSSSLDYQAHNNNPAQPQDNTAAQPHDNTAAQPHDNTATQPHNNTATQPQSHNNTAAQPRDNTAAKPHNDATEENINSKTHNNNNYCSSANQPASLEGQQLPSVAPHGSALRRPLEEDDVALYKDVSLDELRRLACTHAQTHRLTAELRLDIDQIYERYQWDLHVFAITNKLHPSPMLKHVGNKSRIRGSTIYNNFCLYNPEASLIHHDYSKSSKQRANLTGALWRKLDKASQVKYGNPDYLETLPNPFIAIQEAAAARASALAAEDTEPSGAPVQMGPKKRRKQYVDMKPDQWAKKTILDMKRIGEAYQVKGFLVLVSQKGKRVVINAGGSYLGQEYLDMTERDKKVINAASDFCVATGGRYNKEWLSNTQSKLQELGVSLRVKSNIDGVTPSMFCGTLGALWDIDLQYLKVAIGEGWFELTGRNRGVDLVDVVGADRVLDNVGLSEEEDPVVDKTKQKSNTPAAKNSNKASTSNANKPNSNKSKAKVGQKRSQPGAVATKPSKRTLQESEEEEEEEDETSNSESEAKEETEQEFDEDDEEEDNEEDDKDDEDEEDEEEEEDEGN